MLSTLHKFCGSGDEVYHDVLSDPDSSSYGWRSFQWHPHNLFLIVLLSRHIYIFVKGCLPCPTYFRLFFLYLIVPLVDFYFFLFVDDVPSLRFFYFDLWMMCPIGILNILCWVGFFYFGFLLLFFVFVLKIKYGLTLPSDG